MTSIRRSRWQALAALGVLWGATVAVNRALRDVEGRSMAPALTPGDRLVIVPARLWQLRRGDVVVLRDPRERSRCTVKRVVGLAGEHVTLRRGRLVVDGVTHAEPYVTGPVPGQLDVTVPADHVIVMGDNRAASADSRAFGPVPRTLIAAVVVATVRPRLRVGLRESSRAVGAA